MKFIGIYSKLEIISIAKLLFQKKVHTLSLAIIFPWILRDIIHGCEMLIGWFRMVEQFQGTYIYGGIEDATQSPRKCQNHGLPPSLPYLHRTNRLWVACLGS